MSKKASSQSPFTIARRKFIKNKPAIVASCILLLIFLISLISPLIAPYDPNVQNLVQIKGDMSIEHWLGTDAANEGLCVVPCRRGIITKKKWVDTCFNYSPHAYTIAGLSESTLQVVTDNRSPL
ncbi:hypothetical protein [Streptococcus suis]